MRGVSWKRSGSRGHPPQLATHCARVERAMARSARPKIDPLAIEREMVGELRDHDVRRNRCMDHGFRTHPLSHGRY